MKHLFTLLTILLITYSSFAQSAFPDFLEGTWKIENKNTYEHWDRLNDHTLKGFSYMLNNGQVVVSEYLDISRSGNKTVYTATVLGQNKGEGVRFELTYRDSTFTFENSDHDFPTKIVYQKRSDTELFVSVSGRNKKDFSYTMTKQNGTNTKADSSVLNPNYDPVLAEEFGGDDYGMKSYFWVILKTGANTTADKVLISESFKGHMDNINRLVEEGKLIVAGPLGGNENQYRGIFILDHISSQEEAEKILQSDPAIKNGLLDYEIFSWYGSAALPAYLPISDRIWKLKP